MWGGGFSQDTNSIDYTHTHLIPKRHVLCICWFNIFKDHRPILDLKYLDLVNN